MGIDHYENFPVASVLLPAALRSPIEALYRFARTADDIADEGNLTADERLQRLAEYEADLKRLANGECTLLPEVGGLAPHLGLHNLPIPLLADLIDAFKQDVAIDRYPDWPTLLDYCRRSANPVGRLLLRLFKQDSPINCERSDAICTALQLINHWQDVAIDLGKGDRGRIYLPQDEMARFGVTEHMLMSRVVSAEFSHLMAFQVARARQLMQCGAPLGWDLPGRLGLEIRAIVAGGLRILSKIESVGYDVFNRRPVLRPWDWGALLWPMLVRPL